jgi:iron(III) transport system permease protein
MWEKFPSATFVFYSFIVAVLLWLILIPLAQTILSSFRTGHPAVPGPFTFNNYLVAYSSPLTYRMILNTIVFAGGGTFISLFLAILFAWLIERTDMPLRNVCWALILIPMAMPGLLFSMAYVLLLMPNVGIVNVLLRHVISPLGIQLTEGPINIYSLGGMIFLDGFRGVVTAFLLMVGAFRMMDPALEEASWASGADNWATLRKVTVPVLLPAVLAAAIYCLTSAMESLEAPLLVGVPGRIFVYSTMIYFSARGPIDNYGMGGAFAVSYLLTSLVLVYFYQRATIRQAERFATVTGKGYSPRVIPLGRWRYPAVGLFFVYFALTIALPLSVLIWASLLPTYQVPSGEALERLTWRNYNLLLTEPDALRAAWNTLLVALTTGTGTVVVAFSVSWLVVRSKVKGGYLLDGLAFASHAIPGVVVALSFIFLYLQPPFRSLGLYGTVWIVSFALMTQYIAFATRTTTPAITQIHRELEEAGEVSGASGLRVLWQITLPLIRPAFIAAWIWVVAHAIRAFSIPVMLASRENQTLSVLLWQYWDDERNLSAAAALGVLLTVVLTLLTFSTRAVMTRGFKKSQ